MIKTCEYCKTPFETKNIKKRFCSPKCSVSWSNLKFRKGKTYEEIYGSQKRAGEEKSKRSKVDKVLLTCEVCKKQYEVLPYESTFHKRFCSRKCYQKWKRGSKRILELHDKGIDDLLKILQKDGFIGIPVGKKGVPKPDIIAFKDNKVYAYEVFRPAYNNSNYPACGNKNKYEKTNTKHFFNEIIWIKLVNGKLETYKKEFP